MNLSNTEKLLLIFISIIIISAILSILLELHWVDGILILVYDFLIYGIIFKTFKKRWAEVFFLLFFTIITMYPIWAYLLNI